MAVCREDLPWSGSVLMTSGARAPPALRQPDTPYAGSALEPPGRVAPGAGAGGTTWTVPASSSGQHGDPARLTARPRPSVHSASRSGTQCRGPCGARHSGASLGAAREPRQRYRSFTRRRICSPRLVGPRRPQGNEGVPVWVTAPGLECCRVLIRPLEEGAEGEAPSLPGG